jgi:hypothetical protein
VATTCPGIQPQLHYLGGPEIMAHYVYLGRAKSFHSILDWTTCWSPTVPTSRTPKTRDLTLERECQLPEHVGALFVRERQPCMRKNNGG